MKMAVHPHLESVAQTHIKVNVPATMTFRRPFSFGQMLHFLVAGAAGHTEMSFYTARSSIKGHLAVSYWLWELNPRQSLNGHFGSFPVDRFSEWDCLNRRRGMPPSEDGTDILNWSTDTHSQQDASFLHFLPFRQFFMLNKLRSWPTL